MKEDDFVTREEFEHFVLGQHRSSLATLAELRALKHILLDHLAGCIAAGEFAKIGGESDEEFARFRKRFDEDLEGRFQRVRNQLMQGFLEQVEDDSPATAAWIDPRAPEDIDTGP